MLKKSRKKFLFGKVYTIIDDIKDRIDDTYITESEMDKIYKSKTVYEINKNNFLNDFYVKSSTKKVEYFLYNSTIFPSEEIKEKDVSEFTTGEIRDLIDSVPTSSKGQQNRVFKFINQYCKWMTDRELINLNPCDGLDKKDFTTNVKALKNKIIGLDKFWNNVNIIMAKGCHVQLVLPIVLSRYGIYGKNGRDLLHLRYDDIDVENKVVNLYYEDGEYKTSVPIDDRFIDIIEKSKHENIVDSAYNGVYLDTGYVIKRSSLAGENNGDIETVPGIVRRVNLAYDYLEGCQRVKFNNLVKSRKLDILFNIRKDRKINTEDVLNVMRIFEPESSVGSYHSLVADIESLTGEKVLYKYEKGAKLIDNNSEEFVKNVVEELEFQGYRLNN